MGTLELQRTALDAPRGERASLEALREALVAASVEDRRSNPTGRPTACTPASTANARSKRRDALYGAMGVERHDREGRRAAYVRNHAFFGAPHVVFIFMHRPFDTREATDLGMYAQTLMLALTSRGIASCAQGALGLYPPSCVATWGCRRNSGCCSASRSATKTRRTRQCRPHRPRAAARAVQFHR